MTLPSETANLAVFCDFENIAIGVRKSRTASFDISKVIELENALAEGKRAAQSLSEVTKIVKIIIKLELRCLSFFYS